MKPITYIGPEGYSPQVGALYSGREFYPAQVDTALLAEWADKGWLDDPANPSAMLVEPARPKRKANAATVESES